MERLSQLPNIGEVLERQIVSVDINSPDELRVIGAKKAWLRILAVDDSACIHRLYSLEGAVRGIKKSMRDENIKLELKGFYIGMKGK